MDKEGKKAYWDIPRIPENTHIFQSSIGWEAEEKEIRDKQKSNDFSIIEEKQ